MATIKYSEASGDPSSNSERKMTSTWARTVVVAKIALLLLIGSAAAETNPATKLLELARAQFGELLPAEENLFRAVANGEIQDYSDSSGKDNDPAVACKWASNRVLRASRIIWLCTDPHAAALATYHGITVKGARIDENIDLDFARFAFPLHFLSCAFTDNWSLRGAHLPFLDLSGSYLRGLQADWAQIECGVFLNNIKDQGELSLVGATIGGNLDCDGGQMINGRAHVLSCDGAKITGNVFLGNGFKAEGEAELIGATIGGDLACNGGQLLNRDGYALSADNAIINGGVFLKNRFKVEGHVSLVGATISGDLDCNDGTLINQAGTALSCDGAKIGGSLNWDGSMIISRVAYALSGNLAKITGNVFLRNGFKAEGGVELVGATIGGNLDCNGGQMINGISCDGAKIADNVFLDNGFKAEGEVELVGAAIGGNLDCDGGILINQVGTALSCDGAKITGNVFLRNGFKAEGEVRLVGATIGGDLACDGGQMINRRGNAFSVDRASITGGVFLRNGFKAEGEIGFVTASVTGYFYWKDVTSPDFAVLDLRSAKVGTLADDEKSWPGKGNVVLDGLTYERIDNNSPTDAESRIKWLKRQRGHKFLPQPYEQLAAVLHKMGHDEEAVKVMISKNEDHARHTRFPSQQWLWYRLFGPLIGYGYRPVYAFLISLAVILLGSLVFWLGFCGELITPTENEACVQSKYRSPELSPLYPKFCPIVYSLETFVPLLRLDMGEYWRPNANRRCFIRLGKFVVPLAGRLMRSYFWFHVIAGWVLTTLWLAGLTGLVKS